MGGYKDPHTSAKLSADYDLSQHLKVQGRPAYILSEGRQWLFGNISYGILVANKNELLTNLRDEIASLCS